MTKPTGKMLAYASLWVRPWLNPRSFRNRRRRRELQGGCLEALFVTNISDFGVGTLSESASLNDGLLDLCILSRKEFQNYLEYGFAFAGALTGNQTSPYYAKK
ncbi:MAG: hypothetical protein R3D26_11105 [Cyanobacteriota/Melainabacteria group bacterium]